MKILVSLLISMLCLTTLTANAKELGSRLGVGFRNNYVTFTLPSVATVYYPNNETAVLGSLGLDTEENNSKFALMAGVRRIVFKEEMMNFYMGGNIAMITNEVASTKDSGFELAALVGGEFFLNGLDSLAFNFESGVGVTNVKKVRFKTMGDSFVSAGIVFYF
jgi:hypothetical protein